MTEMQIESLQYDVLLYSVAWSKSCLQKHRTQCVIHQAAISTCETPMLWREAEQLRLHGIRQDVILSNASRLSCHVSG